MACSASHRLAAPSGPIGLEPRSRPSSQGLVCSDTASAATCDEGQGSGLRGGARVGAGVGARLGVSIRAIRPLRLGLRLRPRVRVRLRLGLRLRLRVGVKA